MKQTKALTNKEYDEELKESLKKYSLDECRKMLVESMSKIFENWYTTHALISNHEYKTVPGTDYMDENDEEHLNELIDSAMELFDNLISNTFADLHIYFPIKYRPSVSLNMCDPNDLSNEDSYLRIDVLDWNYPCFTEENTRDVLRYFLIFERGLLKTH